MQKPTILDANSILRYILYDNPEQAIITRNMMAKYEVRILHEVMAEVIYVMNKFYKIPREKVSASAGQFLKNAICTDTVLINAVENFGIVNLSFVDCILLEYSKQYEVFTFDEKLIKSIRMLREHHDD
jgi:predicted nucleic acid-binding protein